MREYARNKGFYSYNAADETEDPVKRWIGREVKRFLSEAHTLLSFLLRHANAPPDLVETVCNTVNAEGMHLPINTYPPTVKLVALVLYLYPPTTAGHMDMELGDDEELDPTDAELEAEAEAEPGMMRDAGYWDDFLNLVDIMQEPWAAPEADTNEYRQMRAVRIFNAGVLVYSIGLDLLHSLQLRLHTLPYSVENM